MKIISIVVPCFNEAHGLPLFLQQLDSLICSKPEYEFEALLIDDGSKDNTGQVLSDACQNYEWLVALSLTRNFGKEAALTAGLDIAKGNAIVFMDADLQHPPKVIEEFLKYWENGAEVVVGKRSSRQTDSKLYKLLAEIFYYIHNKISDIEVPEGVGDFRLIDRKVADQLKMLKENRRFMKGLFAWVGYAPVQVEYSVAPRSHGSSSFNKWRSWNFALEGITSFSTVPLRVWSYVGVATLSLGLMYSCLIVFNAFFYGVSTPGYVTLLTAIVIFGGIQLIGLGILGEYVGRIYMEVKDRPVYLVANIKRKGDFIKSNNLRNEKFK